MPVPSSEVGARIASALPLQPDHHGRLYVLVPYWAEEATSLKGAARIANKSTGTVRSWCGLHHIGRRVGAGGPWQVSRVALQAYLDGDGQALKAYLSGDRQSPLVRKYYDLVGLGHLLSKGGK